MRAGNADRPVIRGRPTHAQPDQSNWRSLTAHTRARGHTHIRVVVGRHSRHRPCAVYTNGIYLSPQHTTHLLGCLLTRRTARLCHIWSLRCRRGLAWHGLSCVFVARVHYLVNAMLLVACCPNVAELGALRAYLRFMINYAMRVACCLLASADALPSVRQKSTSRQRPSYARATSNPSLSRSLPAYALDIQSAGKLSVQTKNVPQCCSNESTTTTTHYHHHHHQNSTHTLRTSALAHATKSPRDCQRTEPAQR